jgi:hypothetical protein
MNDFAKFVTIDAIVRELCNMRIKSSIHLHQQEFFRRISDQSRNDEAEEDDLSGLFPPRKVWNIYKPLKNQRRRMSSEQIKLTSLTMAVHKMMLDNPSLPWAIRLRERAVKIRDRALNQENFCFRHRCIVGQEKKQGSHEYRPITKYQTDDKIIQKLTMRYLSKKLDPFLSDASCAYRNCQRPAEEINRDSCLRDISNYRASHKIVYVGEADIRNFMDCVSHELARKSLLSLISDVKKNGEIDVDPRAIEIYDAYISSYSFQRDVLGAATEELRKTNGKGYYGWPAEELANQHCGNDLVAIGIPQGGALSCLVVNILLHEVDKVVENAIETNGHEMLYRRFCDDMIILAPDKDSCQIVMDAYLRAIRQKQLLVHAPVDVSDASDPDGGFHLLDLKSKKPYLWARQEDQGMAWIQFLGYLIQYDGKYQIRPQSIQKQIQKMDKEASKLIALIHPNPKIKHANPPDISLKMKPHKILMSFNKKIIAMSVGYKSPKDPMPASKEDIKPKCWADGYKYLWEVPYDPNQLRELDRHRERVMSRIYNHLKPSMRSDKDRKEADDVMHKIRTHGFRFSYYGQFAKKLGESSNENKLLDADLHAGNPGDPPRLGG